MYKTVRYSFFSFLVAGLVLLPLLASPMQTSAAPESQGSMPGNGPVLWIYAVLGGESSGRKVLPPDNYLHGETTQTATIQVNYLGDWDPTSMAAFEYAKSIWESSISSPVPIVVDASWENLNRISPYILGGAWAGGYKDNFWGALYPDTHYPYALANKLSSADLDVQAADIIAQFNSGFSAWYFGTDGAPPITQYDFVSVVVHEIGHGLGFSGSMGVSDTQGYWDYGSGYPYVYDRFVVNGSGQTLVDSFHNPSAELRAQLTGNDLYFAGSHAVAANNGVPPKLYVPTVWERGSSYSHLDENTYPAESGNALMTPALSNGEAIHLPGPIVMGIFEDIGWGTDIGPVPTTPKFYGYLPSILSALPVTQ